MKQTLSYIQPIRSNTESLVRVEALDKAIDQFKAGDHISSIYSVLDYFNSDLRQRYVKEGARKFQIPHGSIVVDFEIGEDSLTVSAPFMALPEASSRIPLLRRAAELNISDLDMAHLYLQGDELHFSFSCPLDLAHPFKVAYMLRELCLTGDKYDDEFMVKFAAKRIYEPKLRPFEPADMQRILEAIRSVAKETMAQVDEFVTERKYNKAWKIMLTGLFKINYFAQPQGALQAELEEVIYKAHRTDRPDSELLPEGLAFLKSLSERPDAELAESLYFVEVISSRRRSSDLENIRNNMQETYDAVLGDISGGNIEDAVLQLTLDIYRIYFFNDLQENLNAVLAPALQQSANVELGTALRVLHKAMKKVMEEMDAAESGADLIRMEDVVDSLDEIQQIQESLLAELQGVDMEKYKHYAQSIKQAMQKQRSLSSNETNAE